MALPKVRRRGPDRRIMYALAATVTVLAGALVYLLVGGSFFTSTPRTDLERDYQVLQDGLRENPDNSAVLMSLAEVEYDMGKKGEAFKHAEQAIDASPEEPYLHTRYATLLARSDRVDEAIEAVLAELEVSGTLDAEPHFLLGQLYSQKGEHDKAVDAMNDGLEIDNKAADMRIVLGEVLERAGRNDEAIEAFKEALTYLPTEQRAIDGLERLGVAYEVDETTDPHGSAAGE